MMLMMKLVMILMMVVTTMELRVKVNGLDSGVRASFYVVNHRLEFSVKIFRAETQASRCSDFLLLSAALGAWLYC